MLAMRLTIRSAVVALACFVSAYSRSEVRTSGGEGKFIGDRSASKSFEITSAIHQRTHISHKSSRPCGRFALLLVHINALSGFLARFPGLGNRAPPSSKDVVDIATPITHAEPSGLTFNADAEPQELVLTPTQATNSFYNAFNARDLDSLASCLTDDCVYEDLLFGDSTVCRGKDVFLAKMPYHPWFALRRALPRAYGKYVPFLTGSLDSNTFEVCNMCAGENKVMVEWHVVQGNERVWGSRGLSLIETDPTRGGKIKRVVDISVAPWRMVGSFLAGIGLANLILRSTGLKLDWSTRKREDEYELHLDAVLADGVVTEGERDYLKKQASELNISEQRHAEMLKVFGWTNREYRLGLRRGSAGLKRLWIREASAKLKKRCLRGIRALKRLASRQTFGQERDAIEQGITWYSSGQASPAIKSQEIITGFYNAFNERDLAKLASFLADDILYEDLFFGDAKICDGKENFLKRMPMHPLFMDCENARDVLFEVDNIVAGQDQVGVEWHVRNPDGDNMWGGHGLSYIHIDPDSGKIKRVIDVSEAPWRLVSFPLAVVSNAFIGPEREYQLKLRAALADGQVTQGECEYLRIEKIRLNIGDAAHEELLRREGWTLSEYYHGLRECDQHSRDDHRLQNARMRPAYSRSVVS